MTDGRAVIAVPERDTWALRELVVLHELAHHVSQADPPHGPAFVAAVGGSGIALMQMGIDAAEDPTLDVPDEVAVFFSDMFTGILLVLGISIVLIGVSALINQVADIYDRTDTFSDLYAAGADPQLLHRALVRAVMAPAIWVSLLAGGLGAVGGCGIRDHRLKATEDALPSTGLGQQFRARSPRASIAAPDRG